MVIDFIEIKNLRKLKSCRIDLSPKSTILVGANNSGKTSAMFALIKFLKKLVNIAVIVFALIEATDAGGDVDFFQVVSAVLMVIGFLLSLLLEWIVSSLKRKINKIKELAQERGIVFQFVAKEKFQPYAEFNHQGIIAQISPIKYYDLDEFLEKKEHTNSSLVIF